MSKSIKGTRTEANLLAAFAGESRPATSTPITLPRQEGRLRADRLAVYRDRRDEKEHAKIWFKLLHDGAVPDTVANLKDAAAGENYEWTDMYARLPRKPARKALRRSPPSLKAWRRSRRNTRSATWRF